MARIAHYRPLIDDWDAFQEAIRQPPLTTVRRNPLKARPDFDEKLRKAFTRVEQADWNPNIYRLPGVEKPGKSLLHWRGEYYVQEESATIPVTVLDPEPGERVLDMAAAPGGKTTQIAACMNKQGVVVANDANSRRMQSLYANIYRTGAASVITSNYGGQNLPEDDTYDRILIDAPCSGEGNEVRRIGEEGRTDSVSSENQRESLSNLQKMMLEKAAKILKLGGTLVYSTCTFAPIENEHVISYAVEELGFTVEPIDLSTPHQSGVREFKDETYNEAVTDTVRIFPHHLQSGGMYVAKLSK